MGQEPFDTVVAAYHGEIYRYLLRVTRRRSEADDLSQEAFLRAYRAYRSLSPDANVRAWLFAIASNLYRNHFRASKRRRQAYARVSAVSGDVEEHGGPEEMMVSDQVRELVESTIDTLPLKQRVAFTLRKIHGVEYEVIGRTLDCSAESARAHVYQALGKIRQRLDGYDLVSKERER